MPKPSMRGIEIGKTAKLRILHGGGNELSGKLALPVAEGYEIVEVSEILRCEAQVNYTHIIFRSGKKVMISKPLKDVEVALAAHGFLRVHQHHLVNLRHAVKYLKGKGGQLLLANGTTVNVSERCKKKLMDALIRI